MNCLNYLLVYNWFLCLQLITASNEGSLKTSTDFLLCRFCGFNIAPATTVVNVKSPAAEGFHNHSLFGLENVEVQSLKNPAGIHFEVVTAKGGTCVGTAKKWQTEDTWYPGHAWKACICSKCSKHIGWIFEPLSTATDLRVYASSNGFYAYILDNIISEAYANSLLVTPKLNSYT